MPFFINKDEMFFSILCPCCCIICDLDWKSGTFVSVINEPYGFLTEWWTIFWDIYSSRELARPQAMENSTVKVQF